MASPTDPDARNGTTAGAPAPVADQPHGERFGRQAWHNPPDGLLETAAQAQV